MGIRDIIREIREGIKASNDYSDKNNIASQVAQIESKENRDWKKSLEANVEGIARNTKNNDSKEVKQKDNDNELSK